LTFKKRTVLFSILVIGIILVSGTSVSAAGGAQKYYMNGYIKTTSGVPIYGASVAVKLNGAYLYTVTSQWDGRFSASIYTSTLPRSWTVMASKSGYYPRTVTTRAAAGSTTYMGDIKLTAVPPPPTNYLIHGYVRDIDTNNPIPNTSVEIYRNVYEGWSKIGDTSTDQTGYYSCSYTTTSPMSQCKVNANANRYEPGTKTVSISTTNVNMGDLLLHSEPTFIIHGNVFDYGTNLEVFDTTVNCYIRYNNEWHSLGTATTSSVNGLFELECVTYEHVDAAKIVISKSGFDSIEELRFGDDFDFDFGNVYFNNPVEKFAVIVGISDYEVLNDLPLSHGDANEWLDYLHNVQEFSLDNIWVYGDSNKSNFSVYSDLATEANVKLALFNMFSQADNNDVVCFIMAGHGGQGAASDDVFLSMWDDDGATGNEGQFWDYEFADIFKETLGERVFIFLATCHSGGMIPELEALPNHESFFVTTHCGPDGVGYQDTNPYWNNTTSFWTHWFLICGLKGEFSDTPDIPFGMVFDWADQQYVYEPDPGEEPSIDDPMLFCGYLGDFYLTLPP